MKTLVLQITIFTILLVILALPLVAAPAFAADEAGRQQIVPCGGPGQDSCTFRHIFELIQRLINFLLFQLAVPLATLTIAIAGIMFFVYGGNEQKRTEAKEYMQYAILGLIVAFAAWIIVNTIMLAFTGAGIGQ